MKSLTAGSFYNRRKELFENNPAYSDFMIKHYMGTRIDIDRVIIDANERYSRCQCDGYLPGKWYR